MLDEFLELSLGVVTYENSVLAQGFKGTECLRMGSYYKGSKTHWAQENENKKTKNKIFPHTHKNKTTDAGHTLQ